MLMTESQSKKNKRTRPRRVKLTNELSSQSIQIDDNQSPNSTWNTVSLHTISTFFQERQHQIQNQHASIKTNCKKVASWGWEMLETLLVMVETFNGLSQQLQVCLKKVPKQSSHHDSELPQALTQEKEYILVLDLDETLIHSDEKRFSAQDFEVNINTGKDQERYFVRKRPFMHMFLEKMAQFFDIYVFTASLKEYADQILNWIDPKGFIKKRFYRDSCTKINGTYYKDLTKVHTDMNKIFIIDNSTSGFSMNPENGMLIKSWYCDTSDNELKQYQKFLSESIAKKRLCGSVIQFLEQLKKQYPRHILN